MRRIKIAIDGPAGAGKSTVAKKVAAALDYLYIDTGAMYRALTLAALRRGIPFTDGEALSALAQQVEIRLEAAPTSQGGGPNRVFLDGEEVTTAIRLPDVSAGVSPVSVHAGVREVMVQRQRVLAREGGVVMDGRDIGTVVLPEAELKIFLTASVEERARRRYAELQAAGVAVTLAEMRANIEERDRIDSGREVAPLRPAPDAHRLDSTGLTVAEVVAQVLTLAREKIEEAADGVL